MYKQALSNVLQYLVSNGVIIIHGSIGEHTYTVGSAALPAMEATEDMLMKIFHDLNLKIVRWEICVKLTTHYYCILRKTWKYGLEDTIGGFSTRMLSRLCDYKYILLRYFGMHFSQKERKIRNIGRQLLNLFFILIFYIGNPFQ